MIKMPAEFEEQSFVQLIFPHKHSDWIEYLEEAQACFIDIATAIARYEKCLIICDNLEEVKTHFKDQTNLYFIQYQSDDTWARDCSALSVVEDEKAKLIDFRFNGWGDKFEAERDNTLSSTISDIYSAPMVSEAFVLEGGSIESDGEGVLLTTSACLLNPNRNPEYTKTEIESYLSSKLGSKKTLWLHHGELEGDDTDAHIDTLARFISKDTIMYVACENKNDTHFKALQEMKKELASFTDLNNRAYKLIALPHPEPIYYDNERLPATYANFLMINGAVLVPIYNVKEDASALEVFRSSFKDREIIPIDCSLLIRQHGSLHCVSMQFPKSVTIR